jgi:hypothetical protein
MSQPTLYPRSELDQPAAPGLRDEDGDPACPACARGAGDEPVRGSDVAPAVLVSAKPLNPAERRRRIRDAHRRWGVAEARRSAEVRAQVARLIEAQRLLDVEPDGPWETPDRDALGELPDDGGADA